MKIENFQKARRLVEEIEILEERIQRIEGADLYYGDNRILLVHKDASPNVGNFEVRLAGEYYPKHFLDLVSHSMKQARLQLLAELEQL